MRRYVDIVAPMLDTLDHQKHFARVVPELAASDSLLFRVVLATADCFAAATRGNTGHNKSAAQLQYFRQEFYVEVDQQSDRTDEVMIALLVLIRLLEMQRSEIPNVPNGIASRLAWAPFADNLDLSRPFQRASRVVLLQQDLDWYLIQQMPLSICWTSGELRSDASNGFRDDLSAAEELLLLCSQIITFCFDDTAFTYGGHVALRSRLQQWDQDKPSAFRPIGLPEGALDTLPLIWHSNQIAVTVSQYYCLAEMFPCTYDPTLPRLGDERVNVIQRITVSAVFGCYRPFFPSITSRCAE